jgi:hypothetical protein
MYRETPWDHSFKKSISRRSAEGSVPKPMSDIVALLRTENGE